MKTEGIMLRSVSCCDENWGHLALFCAMLRIKLTASCFAPNMLRWKLTASCFVLHHVMMKTYVILLCSASCWDENWLYLSWFRVLLRWKMAASCLVLCHVEIKTHASCFVLHHMFGRKLMTPCLVPRHVEMKTDGALLCCPSCWDENWGHLAVFRIILRSKLTTSCFVLSHVEMKTDGIAFNASCWDAAGILLCTLSGRIGNEVA